MFGLVKIDYSQVTLYVRRVLRLSNSPILTNQLFTIRLFRYSSYPSNEQLKKSLSSIFKIKLLEIGYASF